MCEPCCDVDHDIAGIRSIREGYVHADQPMIGRQPQLETREDDSGPCWGPTDTAVTQTRQLDTRLGLRPTKKKFRKKKAKKKRKE
jgi:hypothetical protein